MQSRACGDRKGSSMHLRRLHRATFQPFQPFQPFRPSQPSLLLATEQIAKSNGAGIAAVLLMKTKARNRRL